MVEDDRNAETLLEAPPPPPPPLPPPLEPQKGAAGGEPIAPTLGVDYAFPPHLGYAYPPPDGNILTNVVNALIAVPRFYTQVLHLMNKMNLPPPFRPALPTPPLPPPAPAPTQPALKRQARDLSSGESELESSEEEEQSEATDGTAEGVEKIRVKKPKKRMKRVPIQGPALDKGVSHEAAGVKSEVIPKATTTIKKKAPVLQIKITPKTRVIEVETSASKLEGEEEAMAPTPSGEAHEERQATASREELEGGKLQASDMLALPIFKNYAPGNPTPNLYIKNLAKDVTADDMYHIYGAFFHSRAEALEQLSVKVMQEGRMRGQAFVYCPSAELAMAALEGTHGYVLKGKPMVVQYGRKQAVTKSDATASGGHEQ